MMGGIDLLTSIQLVSFYSNLIYKISIAIVRLPINIRYLYLLLLFPSIPVINPAAFVSTILNPSASPKPFSALT